MRDIEIETEALFYRLLHSYLLYQPYFKEDYYILLDHYKKYGDSFKSLKKHELLWIKKIQNDVKNDTYSLFSGKIDFNSPILESLTKEKTSQNHKDICRELIKRKDELLTPLTGTIDFINTEHPTVFGIIDILIQSGRCAYVLEIKSTPADHKIIGQMMKYYVGLCLKIILKFYDEVKMISLCPGYDPETYKDLKRIGVSPYTIAGKPLQIIQR